MVASGDNSSLLDDLMRLTETGSDDTALAGCAALLTLQPVSQAIGAGAPARRAVLVILKKAAEVVDVEDKEHAKNVRAAAALTGVYPRNVGGQGKKSSAGPGARSKEAGEILGCTAKTASTKIRVCCEAYEHAVYDYVSKLSREPTQLEDFLVACGINGDDAARLARVPASTPPLTRTDHQSSADDGNLHARLARSIPLSGVVRLSLDAAVALCRARNRSFYTPDLLIALLDMPRGRTADCFDETRAGLARRVHEALDADLRKMNPSQVLPFQPFEWTERPDVRLAQDLALVDASAVVTEIYLLLGVLGSDSGTRRRLIELLEPEGYDRLCAIANDRRNRPPDVLKTPGSR
jgi:hypothetical protein